MARRTRVTPPETAQPHRALSNARHEAIALAYYEAKGDVSLIADRFSLTPRSLSDLLYRNPQIRERAAMLQTREADQAIRQSAVSRNEIIESLRETRLIARELSDLSAKNKADELLGRHLGMFTDRVVNRDQEVEGKSIEELEGLVAQAVAELGENTVRRILGNAPGSENKRGKPERSGPAAESAETQQAGAVPPVSEAGDLPPRRLN